MLWRRAGHIGPELRALTLLATTSDVDAGTKLNKRFWCTGMSKPLPNRMPVRARLLPSAKPIMELPVDAIPGKEFGTTVDIVFHRTEQHYDIPFW